MVSVSTHQKQSLADNEARQAESLRRYLEYLADELNTTVGALQGFGFDANISVSDDGAAPGN